MNRHLKFSKLNDLGTVARGKSKHRPRNDPSLYGGPYPFIQTGDVKRSNFYVTNYTQTYNEKGLAQSKLWEPGTLCITIAANIADTAILGIKACFPDSIIGFVPNKKHSDVRFVKYCLESYKLQIQAISQGTTQDNLSLEKLLSINFNTPELKVQRKIAAILTAYDDLIETNKRRITLLEKMAEELYREWFVRMRFPGYQNTKFVKGVPEGWEVKPINSLVKFLSGYSFKSEKYVKDGRFGIVTIKNVHDGLFFPDCSDSLDRTPSNMKNYCFLATGDILLSLTGNVGRVCRVYGSNLLLNQRVAKLKPSRKNSNSFVYYFFKQKSLQTFIEMIATGTAQQNLSPIKLGNQKTVIPSQGVLDSFEAKVGPIGEQLLILFETNRILTQTRDLLLPRLISGKLSVEDLDIQLPPSMREEAG